MNCLPTNIIWIVNRLRPKDSKYSRIDAISDSGELFLEFKRRISLKGDNITEG